MTTEAERRRAAMAQLGKAWGLALEFIVSILLFAGIGWGLDTWLGTEPWLILGGLAFGLIGGVYRLVRQAGALNVRAEGRMGDRGDGGPSPGERPGNGSSADQQ